MNRIDDKIRRVTFSIEPTDSLEGLKKCIDSGAAGAVVKTTTDLPRMAELTQHSKYAILKCDGAIHQRQSAAGFRFL